MLSSNDLHERRCACLDAIDFLDLFASESDIEESRKAREWLMKEIDKICNKVSDKIIKIDKEIK